jgi:NADPH-dependent 2,4-dienoyl-CoA reductase/sulfur reductase-like enzyme
VLVFDQLGGRPGFSAAEYLAERGHAVTLVTPMIYPGYGIETLGWRLIYQRLLERGVEFRPLVTLAGVERDHVRLRHVYTGAEERADGFETIVTATLPRARNSLYRELKDVVPEIHLIGDAAAPRGIEEAVYEGHKVGRAI